MIAYLICGVVGLAIGVGATLWVKKVGTATAVSDVEAAAEKAAAAVKKDV